MAGSKKPSSGSGSIEPKKEASLGVLLTAYMYKRKSGLKTGWRRLFIVLTEDTLHWFKRQEGSSLFGILKGLVPLDDITEVNPVVDPEAKKFEIRSVDGKKRLFQAETAESCSLWVNAVDQAIQARKAALKVQTGGGGGGGGGGGPSGPPGALRRQDTLDKINFLAMDASRPEPLMVSIATTDTSREVRPERVSRKGRGAVRWGAPVAVDLRRPARELLAVLFAGGAVAHLHAPALVEAALTMEPARLPLEEEAGGGHVSLAVAAREEDLPRLRRLLPPSGGGGGGGGGGADNMGNTKKDGVLKRIKNLLLGLLGIGAEGAPANPNQAYALAVLTVAAAASTLLAAGWRDAGATALLGALLAARTFVAAYRESDQEENFDSGESIFLEITFSSYHSADGEAMAPASALPPVPQKFVDGCFQDMVEAKRRWAMTYRWRVKEKIDTILDEPQPHFKVIKQHYPHFMCGRAKSGNIVYYERLGEIDLGAIAASGVTVDQCVRHYVFITEYLWRILSPGDKDKTVSVLDVAGVRLSDLAGDVLDFVKKSSAVIQNNYPESAEAILLVNCPSWFSLLWKIVKPLVNEVTQKKIRIVNTANSLGALREFIPEDQIPAEYGGQLNCGGEARFHNELEKGLYDFVEKIGNQEAVAKRDMHRRAEEEGGTAAAAGAGRAASQPPSASRKAPAGGPPGMGSSDSSSLLRYSASQPDFAAMDPGQKNAQQVLLDIDDNDGTSHNPY